MSYCQDICNALLRVLPYQTNLRLNRANTSFSAAISSPQVCTTISPRSAASRSGYLPTDSRGWGLVNTEMKQPPTSLASQASKPSGQALSAGKHTGISWGRTQILAATGKTVCAKTSCPCVPSSPFRGAQPQNIPLQFKLPLKAMLVTAINHLRGKWL